MSECLLYIFLSASAVMQKFAMETWIEKEGEREGGGEGCAYQGVWDRSGRISDASS